MRGVAALAVALAMTPGLGAEAGCQSRRTDPPPAPAATPGAAATSPAGSAADAAAQAVPAHVRLPRSPDVPARPTTRPLTRAELDRLSAVEFPDFEREDRGAAPDPVELVEVRHTTKTRPRLAVTVAIGPCTRARACPAMALAGWTARRDELARQLPAALIGRPETRFEIGARTIAGAPAIYTYQLGYAAGTDDKDQPSADYSDAYVVYYNDGRNQLRVMAHYVDDAVGGIDQLLAIAPPEDLEKLAVAFASFYVRSWTTS
jgi:hypothetical protein